MEIDEKEIKKEFAGQKRKVIELAGEIHDIVEDTIWTDYKRLLTLAENLQVAMEPVTKMKQQYDFLK